MDGGLHALMSRLVGTWRTQGRMVEDGRMWAGFDIYEWFPGQRQLVHRVDVQIFGGRKEAMEFLTPREGSPDTFDQISFDADGTVERSVGYFDPDGRYHNETAGARALATFDGPELISARWEQQGTDGSWSHWMAVRFTRIGAPNIEVRTKERHV